MDEPDVWGGVPLRVRAARAELKARSGTESDRLEAGWGLPRGGNPPECGDHRFCEEHESCLNTFFQPLQASPA